MEDATAPKDGQARKALGRGLAALIPTAATAGPTSMSQNAYRLLPIERVHPNKQQPRKQFAEEALEELAASIKEQGILQPLVVRRSRDGYEIVAGERRWRAASRAGLHEVPALIKDFSESTALQVALIENIQRQDLDPLEEAEAFTRLIRDHKLTHDEVARRVGKSRSAISNALRLLKLPEQVLAMLADGRLTAGHARALMTLADQKAMLKLASDLAARKASVRDAEIQARAVAKGQKPEKPRELEATAAQTALEERLQLALGTKVRLRQRQGRGHIEIYFHSLQELDTVLDKLSRSG